MQEIKFKQALINCGVFCGWHYWGFLDGKFIGPNTNADYGVEGALKHSYQFTGLYDKNKVEIYKKDILRLNYSEHYAIDGIVRWFSANTHITDGEYGMELARWVLDQTLLETGTEAFANVFHMSVESIREVIGNTWENPELVNATSKNTKDSSL